MIIGNEYDYDDNDDECNVDDNDKPKNDEGIEDDDNPNDDDEFKVVILVDSCVSKAGEVVTDTGAWIKEFTANLLETISSSFGEFLDLVEENPFYLGLLGLAVCILFSGVYVCSTRKTEKSD